MNTIRDTEVEGQLRIPLDLIRVNPAIQQRAAGTSQDIVDEYAEAMRNGAEFPPIDVFNSGDGGFDLANGFHRLKAHLLAHPDANDIECKVHLGNRDDANFFACGANAQHGLRPSRSDKLKAVTTLIHSEKWSGWSDREIARQCGSRIPMSLQFAAAMWQRCQMQAHRGKRPHRMRTMSRPLDSGA